MTEKKKSIFALIFRIFGLLTGITAITLQAVANSNVEDGFMVNHIFAYFTVQTNIFTTIIFLLLIIKTIVDFVKTKSLQVSSIYPSLHLGCTFYITITMIVYWTALATTVGLPKNPLLISNNLFLHLFTPLCAIIDCIFFFKHGSVNKKDAFKWLIYPVLYLISVVIIANVSDLPYYSFEMNGKVINLMYPYPFLDPQIVTVGGMVGIIFLLLFVFILFGLAYVKIDNLIYKKQQKKIEK